MKLSQNKSFSHSKYCKYSYLGKVAVDNEALVGEVVDDDDESDTLVELGVDKSA